MLGWSVGPLLVGIVVYRMMGTLGKVASNDNFAENADVSGGRMAIGIFFE